MKMPKIELRRIFKGVLFEVWVIFFYKNKFKFSCVL